MKIHCLGASGALPTGGYDANYIIEFDKDTLLAFDVGRTWPEALRDSHFKWQEIDNIFISHLHADHTGGMEWLAFNNYFKRGFPFGEHKPNLFGAWEVIHELWNNCLKAGLESIQGQTNKLDSYFTVCSVPPNGIVNISNCGVSLAKIKIVQTVHVIDDRRIKPSTGIIIEDLYTEKKVFITGDMQFCPEQIRTFYDQVDYIFQDCELAEYPNSVHAQYHQLKTLPEEIRNKMFFGHYDSSDDRTGGCPEEEAKELGFRGFLKAGQVIEI